MAYRITIPSDTCLTFPSWLGARLEIVRNYVLNTRNRASNPPRHPPVSFLEVCRPRRRLSWLARPGHDPHQLTHYHNPTDYLTVFPVRAPKEAAKTNRHRERKYTEKTI